MDIRIQKTKNAIYNAFLEERAHKPIEKITVKEICQKAMINKSTFYAHYQDIYALSNAIEDEVVTNILSQIQHPEFAFQDLKKFNEEIYYAFLSQSTLTHTLFKESRKTEFIDKIRFHIKDMVFSLNEKYREDSQANILLDYVINGGYYTFLDSKYDEKLVIDTMGNLLESIWNTVKERYKD